MPERPESAPRAANDQTGALPLDQFISYRLLRLSNQLSRQAVQILEREAGLRLPEWRCLAFIGLQPGISTGEIAERTGMDRGLISRSVQALIDKRLALAERRGGDRRRLRVRPSAAGRRLYRRLLPVMQRRQAHLLDALDTGERSALYRAIDKLALAADDWDKLNRADD